MNNEQIIEGLAALPLIVRGSRDEVFKAIRELQQEARRANPAAPGSPSPAEPRACVKCGHEERFSDNEAGYCQKLLASERNHWHAAAMECGCQCEFVDNEEINVGVYIDQD